MQIELVRYTDPDRAYLAKAAAVYLGKTDTDNTRRPLTLLKKKHALNIFRGETARFDFRTSKVIYDHMVTYTTATLRACGGLRANLATVYVPPVEDDDPRYVEIGNRHLKDYQDLVHGIDPETQDPIKKKRLQSARTVAPTGVELHYTMEFNFSTLIEKFFPQRLWVPGAQPDTVELAQAMWDLVYAQDPELWDVVKELYGPEAQAWDMLRLQFKKKCPEEYERIMNEFGKMKSMWD